MFTYCMSDIHGELGLFERAIEWIDADRADQPANLVLLGDYVDRGPDSRGCISLVQQLVNDRDSGLFTTALKGNHEDMMVRAVDGHPAWTETWLVNGGMECLGNYAFNDRPDEIDKRALGVDCEFLRSLPMIFQDEDRIYTHAGLNGAVSLEEQEPYDLLWMRPVEMDTWWPAEGWGRMLVHGHTPFNRGVKGRRICVDTGAPFKDGYLAVFKFAAGQPEPVGQTAFKKPKLAADAIL